MATLLSVMKQVPMAQHPGAPSRCDARQQAERPGQPTRFRCPQCRQEYGDPLYHGPFGHAPQELCFDCWATEWAIMEIRMSSGGRWELMDAALFLICQGFTQQEAAHVIGASPRTIHNWIRSLRQRPEDVPLWLLERVRARRGVRP